MAKIIQLYTRKDIDALRDTLAKLSYYVGHKEDCSRRKDFSNPESDFCDCEFTGVVGNAKYVYDKYAPAP